MIISFAKRDEHGNASGCRLELYPMTVEEVAAMRKDAVADGWVEGRNTRSLSDEELARKTQDVTK